MSKLLTAFRKLIDGGGSLIVIEHNLDVIKSADWVIDLGPEGGEGGGQIVAEGTPEEIAGNLHSHTGQWLARVFRSGFQSSSFKAKEDYSGLPSRSRAMPSGFASCNSGGSIASENPGSRPAARSGRSPGCRPK